MNMEYSRGGYTASGGGGIHRRSSDVTNKRSALRVAQMKNRVRRMVDEDEPFKYNDPDSIPKVGIPPPVLSKVQDKPDSRKSLQNALKHFMSWEPIKFNM